MTSYSGRVYKVRYRVMLKHSCCNFHDFDSYKDAVQFLRDHPNAGWYIVRLYEKDV